jgi:ribosomal protein L31
MLQPLRTMSTTPTPRTDAALCRYEHPAWPGGRKFTVNDKHVVLADFARQLERENADLLSRLTAIEHRMPEELARLERELAEAREHIEHLKEHCRTKVDALQSQTSERMTAEQQRDTLAEALRGIMQVTTPNPYMPYCNDDRVWGIANDALAAVKGGKP